MVPTTPSMADGFQQLEPEIPSGIDDDPPRALTLHPGDVVTLQTISAETNQIEGLTVDERGILHIPLAGDVEVAGLNLTEAEERIEEAIRPFDRSARVTLVLSEPNGQRASVIGAVSTPGRYDVVPGMRLADLLAVAGGPANIEEAGFLIATANLHGDSCATETRSPSVSRSRLRVIDDTTCEFGRATISTFRPNSRTS